MVHLTCALKAVEEHAQRITSIQSPRQNQPSALRRIETIHLSDMTAPSGAAVAPAVTATRENLGATPLLPEGLKSASAGEVLMSAAMSRPQDAWNVTSPAGASFDGSAVTYSPIHHETVA